jgi:Tfp pilus assembly protein PilZ
MAERTNQDTRRHRRQTVRIMVDYVTDLGIRCDYATTLGAGGMFLESEEPLTVGMSIKARFKLPGSEVMHETEGRVVWRRDNGRASQSVSAGGVGVKFIDSDAISILARELEDLDL